VATWPLFHLYALKSPLFGKFVTQNAPQPTSALIITHFYQKVK